MTSEQKGTDGVIFTVFGRLPSGSMWMLEVETDRALEVAAGLVKQGATEVEIKAEAGSRRVQLVGLEPGSPAPGAGVQSSRP